MTSTNNIRNSFFHEGKSISEISRDSGFSRKTVRKYISKDNWNHSNSERAEKPSILDPYKPVIKEWIAADRQMKVKQRHTAWRVFSRLKEEYSDFDVSYRTVANYFKIIKKQIYGDNQGFLPLEHKIGEAQVDFGHADFIEKGTRFTGSYLNLSFPHSNAGYLQLFKGESFECLAEGMKTIFEFIGGVPTRIWFDNASSMVSKILKEGDRNLTESFLRFQNHYQFQYVFCNGGKGNEKGNVENKVGYHRRNLFVPMPVFDDIEQYNLELLERAEKDHDRIHYKKKLPISGLVKIDKERLFPLPGISMDICNYETVRTDAYGKFKMNKGKHTYSSVPRLADSHITVCIRAHNITVLDESMREIVRHTRLYGTTEQESMDWIPYLDQISKRPAALKYTGIYRMLPDPVKAWLDGLKRSECGAALKMLSSLTAESSFEKAVDAFDKSLRLGVSDLDSVLAVFNRYNSSFPEMEKIRLAPDIPDLHSIKTDSSAYDQMLLVRDIDL